MTVTITRGSTVITPKLVLEGYETERTTGNQVHKVLGSNNPDVTFGISTLRSGTFRYFFLTQTPAIACETQHMQPGAFTLVDTDVSSASMTYVPVGVVVTRLDPKTGRWIVTVPFHEVLS